MIISATSASPTTFPIQTAEIEPLAERRTSRPDVENAKVSSEQSLASPADTRIQFWTKWIGATVLGTAILNLLGNYLSDKGFVSSLPILLCILAGLVSLMQVSLFPNTLGRSWIAANAAAGIFLGLLTYLISEKTGSWVKDQLFALWVIGNLVLGPIVMRKIQENSKDFSPGSPGLNSTIEFMEKGARQNIFTMLLSIYLVLAALLDLIVVIHDTGPLNLSDLKNTSFILYGIAGVFVVISFIYKKEIPRNFGFITLALFALLDGINAALYAFLGDYPMDLSSLLGAISLSSGIFFISQREIWEKKNVGFIMLSGYLIALSLASFGIVDFYPALVIAGIFALLAAVFFFRRKEQSQRV